MVTLKCLECSKEFEAQRSSAKFCSTKCRVDYNRRSVDEGVEIAKEFLKVNPNLLVEESATFGIIPRTEEAVLIPEEMPNSHIKLPEKTVFAKATFKELLTEFNLLIDNQAPIKQVEGKLYELIEKSQHHDLNARQSEAIRARCINYLTGQYGKKKPTN